MALSSGTALSATYKNRPEDTPSGPAFVVGVRRFELLTSSVSGKRSPPELNARIYALRCATVATIDDAGDRRKGNSPLLHKNVPWGCHLAFD